MADRIQCELNKTIFPNFSPLNLLADMLNYAALRRSIESGPLAQSAEHLPFKQRVAGSSPARLTI
jgi:hypothetical protein